MKHRKTNHRFGLLILGERIRTSFWLVPTIMAASAVVLSFITLYLDQRQASLSSQLPFWIFGGGAEGARGVLITIGQSMLTIAGVTFSITIVVLSLASSQFGPRILRTFMKDRVNQAILGFFTSTFLYALLTLRAVRSVEESHFVPHLSVTISIILAIVGVGILTYFIHHIAVSVQPTVILAEIAKESRQLTERLFADVGEAQSKPHNLTGFPEGGGRELLAPASGYLETIDYDGLADLLRSQKAVFRSEVAIGDFVRLGQQLGQLFGGSDGPVQNKFSEYFYIKSQRTGAEDLEFLLSQLTEVGVRALSPAIDNPFTAMAALDRLEEAFCNLAHKSLEMSKVALANCDCIIVCSRSFEELLDSAFSPIAVNAVHHPKVTLHYHFALREISDSCLSPERKAAVAAQLRRFLEAAEAAALPESVLHILRMEDREATPEIVNNQGRSL